MLSTRLPNLSKIIAVVNNALEKLKEFENLKKLMRDQFAALEKTTVKLDKDQEDKNPDKRATIDKIKFLKTLITQALESIDPVIALIDASIKQAEFIPDDHVDKIKFMHLVALFQQKLIDHESDQFIQIGVLRKSLKIQTKALEKDQTDKIEKQIHNKIDLLMQELNIMHNLVIVIYKLFKIVKNFQKQNAQLCFLHIAHVNNVLINYAKDQLEQIDKIRKSLNHYNHIKVTSKSKRTKEYRDAVTNIYLLKKELELYESESTIINLTDICINITNMLPDDKAKGELSHSAAVIQLLLLQQLHDEVVNNNISLLATPVDLMHAAQVEHFDEYRLAFNKCIQEAKKAKDCSILEEQAKELIKKLEPYKNATLQRQGQIEEKESHTSAAVVPEFYKAMSSKLQMNEKEMRRRYLEGEIARYYSKEYDPDKTPMQFKKHFRNFCYQLEWDEEANKTLITELEISDFEKYLQELIDFENQTNLILKTYTDTQKHQKAHFALSEPRLKISEVEIPSPRSTTGNILSSLTPFLLPAQAQADSDAKMEAEGKLDIEESKEKSKKEIAVVPGSTPKDTPAHSKKRKRVDEASSSSESEDTPPVHTQKLSGISVASASSSTDEIKAPSAKKQKKLNSELNETFSVSTEYKELINLLIDSLQIGKDKDARAARIRFMLQQKPLYTQVTTTVRLGASDRKGLAKNADLALTLLMLAAKYCHTQEVLDVIKDFTTEDDLTRKVTMKDNPDSGKTALQMADDSNNEVFKKIFKNFKSLQDGSRMDVEQASTSHQTRFHQSHSPKKSAEQAASPKFRKA